MRDPLEGKQVRLIVQVQNAGGEWLDADVVPMDRRGPNDAFSSGAVGYYAGANVSIHGRPGRVGVTFTESGSKGVGIARDKDSDKRKAASNTATKSFYSERPAGTTLRQRTGTEG